MSVAYVELRAKSFYSFGTGASHVHELLAQAVGYGYGALALALADANLCGALSWENQSLRIRRCNNRPWLMQA